jgi:hypothetical protein
MVRTGGLWRIFALIAVVGVVGVASAALAASAPPHDGPWSIRAYSFGVGPGLKPIDQFTGSFKVTRGGSTVTDMRGVTGTANHSGCNAHVQLKSVGNAVIKHVADSTAGSDYYWVGTGNELWEKVKFTALARGSKHAVTTVASLRIWFPGGVGDYPQGVGIGNLEVASSAVGVVCNLNFDVR